MVNQELLGYVRKQIAANVPRDEISKSLVTQGWSEQDIAEAFASLSQLPVVSMMAVPAAMPVQSAQAMPAIGRSGGTSKTILLLLATAMAIAVAMYGGLYMMFSERLASPSTIVATMSKVAGSEYALYLLPAVFASLLLALGCWLAGRRILKKEGRPFLGFLFGATLYPLIIMGVLGGLFPFLARFANSLPEDGGFIVGLLLSIFMPIYAQIFFVGMLVCMALLIMSACSKPQEPLALRSPVTISVRYAVIGLSIAVCLYAFGVLAPVAQATHQRWLCNLVYGSAQRTSCYLETSATASSEQNAAQGEGSGEFVIVKTDYKQIKDLHEVGGKLAYAYESDDKTSGVVYDGNVISGAYQKVGILPIAEVGGTLAYEAYKGEKQIIVWNGKEYGEQYDAALRPTDVGGKLAYLAQIGKSPNVKQIVVWDGHEYGTEYSPVGDIADLKGSLVFKGSKGQQNEYIVVGDKAYGPYTQVRWIKETEGHVVAQVDTAQGSQYFLDDKVATPAYGTNDLVSYAVVADKLAYSVRTSDKKMHIMYEGREAGEGAAYESGPYAINGKLAYVGTNADGTSQLMVDGQAIGPKISGNLENIGVSEGGRVAIQTEDANKDSVVYLDGKEVFKGRAGNPFGFFGEKLLFANIDNKVTSLWYDGKKIGQGFYGYNYFALVGGKLVIAAFASVDGKIQYSLLLEH